MALPFWVEGPIHFKLFFPKDAKALQVKRENDFRELNFVSLNAIWFVFYSLVQVFVSDSCVGREKDDLEGDSEQGHWEAALPFSCQVGSMQSHFTSSLSLVAVLATAF